MKKMSKIGIVRQVTKYLEINKNYISSVDFNFGTNYADTTIHIILKPKKIKTIK
jgi:hypothetical protein